MCHLQLIFRAFPVPKNIFCKCLKSLNLDFTIILLSSLASTIKCTSIFNSSKVEKLNCNSRLDGHLIKYYILDYNKLLLYRRADDRFIVKNESILPVMWQIRNPEEFVEDFIISQTSGIIPRNDNKVVPVTYIACNVGVISNRQLIIDVCIIWYIYIYSQTIDKLISLQYNKTK